MAIVPEFTHIFGTSWIVFGHPVKMTWLRPLRVDSFETGSFLSDLALLG